MSDNLKINLDHGAGMPVRPEARDPVAAWLVKGGNPSSVHAAGREARQAVEQARGAVAGLIGAKAEEIVFTSCGTESNNWAIRGLLAANRRKGSHVIVSAIEHPSVLLVVRRLEREGVEVAYLPVTGEGLIEPQALKAALTPSTVLVSVMHANGEVGTIQPIRELAAIVHEAGALFHIDAVASAGHVPINVRELRVDALSLSSDQCYGPPGIAALFVREGVRILSMLDGGGQEGGNRSGTENVPAIVGFGAAAKITRDVLPQRQVRTAELRNRLKEGLLAIDGARTNGSFATRLPHNLHVCVDGVNSEALVLGLDQAGIAAGLGSACNSKAMRPSHVLLAMGLSEAQARGALVLTVSEQTLDDEIGRVLEIIPDVVRRLRSVLSITQNS